jgi:SepF-like predicted cell division protein (DUF552 family)
MMTLFPDILSCDHNGLLLKKVTQEDVEYIWETAPLNKLFLVIGCEASDYNDLTNLMQLDWTTWYLMLDNLGNSYGLIRAIPEMDNSISLHGIGWTQPKTSPRTFVFSWYAFHFWLLQNNNQVIKTYCDFNNTNAIKFDLKTGYIYDYWMPAITKKKKIVHLKIEKNTFFALLQKKQINFDLKENTFTSFRIPCYNKGEAITSRAKADNIKIAELQTNSDLEKFMKKHQKDSFFYYYYLLPRPSVYSIIFKDLHLGNMVLTEIQGQNTIVLFISGEIDFSKSLDLVTELKSRFHLKTSDLILLEESISNESLKNALSINFQFSGNHSKPNAKIWIV